MSRRRAIFVCCDGLGRDWVNERDTPGLATRARAGLWCADHRAVFPSVTRVSAASIATGCHPRRHGLHGNRMGLITGGRIVVHDVGRPDFRGLMRAVTGRTLQVPTLAQRVAGRGGFMAFSNVSPGAAYFLDPDHFGHVYHRAGSFAPGGAPIDGEGALAVTHDRAGDWAMTQRFCREVIEAHKPAAAVLWLSDPDLTMHREPLGSPAHREALRGAERCVDLVYRAVERQRAAGEDILQLIGSDHGHESVGAAIDIEAWLAERGLGALLHNGAIAVAGQGTSALLYATEEGRIALYGILDVLAAEPWADGVITADGLSERGHGAVQGVVAAVNMARDARPNAFGVGGHRWTVVEGGKTPSIGVGQHGGWGPDETRPFLVLDHPKIGPGIVSRPTSIVDIAPTILRHLGLSTEAIDGTSL
ncbi:MAG: alkaline phosphatase family protein [Rhodospirillales bacterium]|nr:alkaline phosphatase family protein [Rhodospirillales bacterium]